MNTLMVPIDDLTLDPRLQMRVEMNQETVAEYAENLDSLPPCKVVAGEDGHLWLTDGWHTEAAHRLKGKTEISCVVRPGTWLEAVAEAAGANAKHGLRRTKEDKRRAVEILHEVNEENNSPWNQSDIARIADVDRSTAGKIIREIKKGLDTSENGIIPYNDKNGGNTQPSQPSNSTLGETGSPVEGGAVEEDGAEETETTSAETPEGKEPSTESPVSKEQPSTFVPAYATSSRLRLCFLHSRIVLTGGIRQSFAILSSRASRSRRKTSQLPAFRAESCGKTPEDGRLLDGHNRLDIDPNAPVAMIPGSGSWTDEECRAFIYRCNRERRNMSAEQKRDLREREKADAVALRQRDDKRFTQDVLAKMFGVDRSVISDWTRPQNESIVGSHNTFGPPDARVTIPKQEHKRIAERAQSGETNTSIANDYKVMRQEVE